MILISIINATAMNTTSSKTTSFEILQPVAAISSAPTSISSLAAHPHC